jgi:hypothetical protein
MDAGERTRGVGGKKEGEERVSSKTTPFPQFFFFNFIF